MGTTASGRAWGRVRICHGPLEWKWRLTLQRRPISVCSKVRLVCKGSMRRGWSAVSWWGRGVIYIVLPAFTEAPVKVWPSGEASWSRRQFLVSIRLAFPVSPFTIDALAGWILVRLPFAEGLWGNIGRSGIAQASLGPARLEGGGYCI